MHIRAAINGYGRIGRNILRAIYENGYREKIKIVAINDLGDKELNAHLTEFDSIHGRFKHSVQLHDEGLAIAGDNISIIKERDPNKLPWADLGVDLVFECTGLFTNYDAAYAHISSGAKKVVVSAPASNVDATVVYGVNDSLLSSDHTIISNASCTTNCLAPIAKVLNDTLGIERGNMTTIHAYTNDQSLQDVYHSDVYRARAATQSMIPTKTGAAQAVGLVLPELDGKLDGMAIRVPVSNVSLIDFHFVVGRETDVGEVNEIISSGSENNSMKGVLRINTRSLVSVDFNHNSASANFDATQTRVNGRLVKVMAWYDNEWGFSNRMLDNAIALMAVA